MNPPSNEIPWKRPPREVIEEAAQRSPNLRMAYLRNQMIYGGRRWAIVASRGYRKPDGTVIPTIWALAVRVDLIEVVDFEAVPPEEWLRYPHQFTTRGVHVYFPGRAYWPDELRAMFDVGRSTGRQKIIEANRGPMAARHWLETRNIRDGRFCRLSWLRGYYHERPRTGIIVRPQGIKDLYHLGMKPEWLEILNLHREWHAYAVKWCAEHGPPPEPQGEEEHDGE